MRLKRKGVISDDVESRIKAAANVQDAQDILYVHLMQHADVDILMKYFDVVSSAADNPAMEAFGRKVKEELQQEGTTPPQPTPLQPTPPQPTPDQTEETTTSQSPPQPAQSAPAQTAKEVLGRLRDRFIEEVASKDIVYNLKHKNIITDSVLAEVNREPGATRQSEILYYNLERTSTKDSLITVCEVIIAVRGNSKMQKFGQDMKSMLKALSGGTPST